MDDFFLRPEQRTKMRLAEIGGNVDYERFYREVLIPLKKKEPFAYCTYEWSECSYSHLTLNNSNHYYLSITYFSNLSRVFSKFLKEFLAKK